MTEIDMPVPAEKVFLKQKEKQGQEALRSLEEMGSALAHQSLTETYKTTQMVPFDNRTPFVFFSDCHRGTRGKTDFFAANEELFYYALSYYDRAGFSYVEVGDGDEMYKYPFSQIQRSYGRIFELLHRLNDRRRLLLVAGNHDLGAQKDGHVDKGGIIAYPGLLFRHVLSGRQLFVVHGHQVDLLSSRYRTYGRLLVRCFMEPLLQLGVIGFDPAGEVCCFGHRSLPTGIARYIEYCQHKLEERIAGWARRCGQLVICGHTHRPSFSDLPYLNTGSCLVPGELTGLEMFQGQIVQVKWLFKQAAGGGAPRVRRELMSLPRALTHFQ